ncbi:MAG TPA: ShlB/FhaC/HecB family hemolysin secretion/activation protein [Patescibacteria group bacterium]|nr:ShlB/FhaC/HecB family hemolysin secretion/activation protein [Patescibacteria group bacterium]
MTNKRIQWLAAAVLLLCTAWPMLAQAQLTPADIERANRDAERIQREEMIRQREDAQRNLQNKRAPAQIQLPDAPVPNGTGEGCRDIKTVKITDAPRMSKRAMSRITGKYGNKCLGVAEIQALLGEVTAYYINKGYSTTRAYLPAQDLSTGTLTIQVVEGTLKKVELDEKNRGTLFIPGAFPFVNDRVLNLRDIEQGLDQVNRLQSNNASIDIVPGAKVGESTIVVRNEPGKRWHLNLGADNYGTKSTGRYQGSATVSYDNLLHLNEFYSYTRRQTIPTDGDGRFTRSNSALFSVPFGYSTVTAGYSDSEYSSTLVTPSALSVDLDGTTRSAFIMADRVVYRDKTTKGTLTASLTRKDNKNYVQNALLTVSSHTLSVLDLGGNISTRIGDDTLTCTVGYSRGLDAFGAEDDLNGLPGSAPRAQFERVTLAASLNHPFRFRGNDMMWSSQLSSQYALDALFGSEQFSLGGVYTVRGFYEDTLANDHGFYIRNDLAMPRTVAGPGGRSLLVKPYLAVDGGAVGGRAAGTPAGTLIGAAAGLSLSLGTASFDAYIGHPIVAPDALNTDDFNGFARLSVNF